MQIKKANIMPAVDKVANEKTHVDIVIVDNVTSHAQDPFFVKKVADAKKALRKITLPVSKSK